MTFNKQTAIVVTKEKRSNLKWSIGVFLFSRILSSRKKRRFLAMYQRAYTEDSLKVRG